MTGEGSASYARRDGTYVLRLQGEIRYTLGHALDTFLDRIFAQDDFEDIVVDLSEVESIDSTGLGLLAKVANFLRKRDGRKPLLFSPRGDINTLLGSMCLDEVFVVCDSVPAAAPAAIPPTDPSAAQLAQTVLAAHRLLCDMNENNRALFHDVVDALQRDLDRP
jgi:anti-anti-sigma factor